LWKAVPYPYTVWEEGMWQPLAERWTRSKAVMMYRIVNGLVAIPPFELYTTSSVARGHIDSLSHMSELHPKVIPSSQTV
jgi:hypothetical protein